jgi:hypothetical protein
MTPALSFGLTIDGTTGLVHADSEMCLFWNIVENLLVIPSIALIREHRHDHLVALGR